MEQYTIWENTPLRWHNFVFYLALPFSVIYNAARLASYGDTMRNLAELDLLWIGFLDIFYYIISILVASIAVFGGIKANRYRFGPACYIALLCINAGYSFVCIIIGLALKSGDSYVSDASAVLLSFLILLFSNLSYYRKRRLLFWKFDAKAFLSNGAKFHPGVLTLGLFSIFLLAALIAQNYYFEKEIERLNEEILLHETKIESKDGTISDLNKAIDKYKENHLENKEELDFWRNYAVIVTESGEKYHTYGCRYVQGKEFWIYNVDLAVSKGYERCSVCNPPWR